MANLYTKANLVEALTLHNEIDSKAQATRIIDHIFESLTTAIAEGNDTVIPNIGTAKVVHRDARIATKPGTTEKVNVPAKNVVKIKVTAPLNRAVN